MPCPSCFTSRKETWYPLYRRPGEPQGLAWRGAENLAPTEIQFPDSKTKIKPKLKKAKSKTENEKCMRPI
jgi:hypothetical protein